jgi:hypothetical protein
MHTMYCVTLAWIVLAPAFCFWLGWKLGHAKASKFVWLLQSMIENLADRVVKQSDLISKRAERTIYPIAFSDN